MATSGLPPVEPDHWRWDRPLSSGHRADPPVFAVMPANAAMRYSTPGVLRKELDVLRAVDGQSGATSARAESALGSLTL